LKICGDAFRLDASGTLPVGVSEQGIGPGFSTAPPISLYGSTKLACEIVALEYGAAYDFPVWVNRCGVLAGAGQFGTPDQGIFSYWINAHLRRCPLKYLGFDGQGRQVRDLFHPRDLASLLAAQMRTSRMGGCRVYTAGGGPDGAMSLAQLNRWCDARFGAHMPECDATERPYDIPWMIMDNSLARCDFGWVPAMSLDQVLQGIATHAEKQSDWLERSGL
jgi:CDP-paratose 2-epimerase